MSEHDKRGRPPYADVLTPAEWRVVEGVRHGMTNPQIARRRGISVDAVKYHVANALLKLGFPAASSFVIGRESGAIASFTRRSRTWRSL